MTDDEGNIFGSINIIDALVILVVSAMIVSAAALILQPDTKPSSASMDRSTISVTVDLQNQPAYIVDAINEGDTFKVSDDTNLTLTDLHFSPRGDDIGVLARVEIEGPAEDGSLIFGDAPLRLGRTVEIVTDRYQVEGQIRAVGDGNALDRAETSVVLTDEMDAASAESIAPDDEIKVSGRTVATIEDVATYTTSNPETDHVSVVATLDAHREQGTLRFGGTAIRSGQTLMLPSESYTIDGTIERVGEEVSLRTTESRTVTLRMESVRQDMADAIRPGMTERAGGETIAEVTDVETEPSLIITTGDNGSVNVVDHPIERDVTITTDLQVRQTAGGVQFKGRPIRQGSTVVLDLGTVTVDATVVSVGE